MIVIVCAGVIVEAGTQIEVEIQAVFFLVVVDGDRDG
jgi:hypothetical protein